MKMLGLGHSGSMTFPMSYDFQGEYYDCSRKGWKGLTSLEKSLSVSLGVTSALSVALMIAVIVVGVTRDTKTCDYAALTTAPPQRCPSAPPVEQCTTLRARPPRRGNRPTTEMTTSSDDGSGGGGSGGGDTSSQSQWVPNGVATADCIVPEKSNSTICLAPQCFRMAGSIIDSIDFSANPCQNFYEFACGNWVKNNPIPDFAQKWDHSDTLEERVLRGIREILELEMDPVRAESEPRSLQLAQHFYHSCLRLPDDEVGVAEMRLLLEEIATLGTDEKMHALALLLSRTRRSLSGNYIISLEVDVNDKNTTENAIYLDQPVLALPFLLQAMDIDLDISSEETSQISSTSYRALARKLWLLVYPEDSLNIEKVLEEIYSFEGNLTRIRTNSTNDSDPEGPQTFSKFTEIYDAELSPEMISWLSGFVDGVIRSSDDGSDLVDDTNQSTFEERPAVILRNSHYFKNLSVLLNETDGKIIENYMRLRILLSYGLHGSLAFREAFDGFRKAVVRNELPNPRWKSCSQITNHFFGWTISEKFLTVFDGIAKEQITLTAKFLKGALNESLAGVEWIALNETRQYAQNKVELLETFLVFPESWGEESSENSVNSFVEEFYSEINFTDATNYFQNYIEAMIWMSKKKLAEVYQQPGSSVHAELLNKWPKFHYPTETHSHYYENLNHLVLPSGATDRSYPLMDYTFPSLHYGSLGVELAQGIMESVVGKGRGRRANGSIGRWWDNGTASNYREIRECFMHQLHDELQDGNGGSIVEDSILLNGALSLAYQAYQSQTFEQEFDEVLLPGLQDYTPEQLFFLSFTQSQCSSESPSHPDHEESRLLVENALMNSAPFMKHWNCPLPTTEEEEETCKIF